MKVLLSCLYYDYGEKNRGLSYEYSTYYQPLVEAGHDVVYFDFYSELMNSSKSEMNRKLLEVVKKEQPEISFFALYKDEFEPVVLDELRKYSKTFCFFQDDIWRREYTLNWAKHFDYFGTPDPFGLRFYQSIDVDNAIHVPFGSNEYLNKDLGLEKIYDVSFVGLKHPYREWLVKKIEKQGVKVHTFGRKWKNGRVTPEEMVRIFNQTKINLNLSNSVSYDVRYMTSSFSALRDVIKNKKRIEQQKARPFEVCGCGGFLLSYYVPGLEKYFDIGNEIEVYLTPDDLVEKVLLYLENDKLRDSIRNAGYARIISDHVFSKRFKDIIDFMMKK